MFRNIFIAAILAVSIFTSCKKEYVVSQITCEQINIDALLDNRLNPELVALVASYSSQIDSVMNKKIGYAPHTMAGGKPQSLLANFTADVLRREGENITGESIDLAVMNNGGLRAPINQGDVTVGDIFKVFPFENELVILKLTGEQVTNLFKRVASVGGEGVSGCELVIKDNKIASLKIGGKQIEETQIYSLATIDYLADGNSGMSALENAIERINTNSKLRDVMIKYVEEISAQNIPVASEIDNRIVVVK